MNTPPGYFNTPCPPFTKIFYKNLPPPAERGGRTLCTLTYPYIHTHIYNHTLIHTPDTLIPHTHTSQTHTVTDSLRFIPSVALLRVFPTGGMEGSPQILLSAPLFFENIVSPQIPSPVSGKKIGGGGSPLSKSPALC